jgi:hypothetical protein
MAASRLADVRTTGRLAGDAVGALDSRAGAAATLTEARYRAPTAMTLDAERRLAGDLARLAHPSSRTRAAWPESKQTLERDASALRQARPAVAALRFSARGPLVTSAAEVSRGITALDEVINHADRVLRRWQARTRAIRAQNVQRLRALASYANTMTQHLAAYDRMRAETGAFVHKVDDQGVTFEEASQSLRDGAAARQNLKETVGALAAPAGLAAAQNRLVSILGDAAQAMQDALDGISQYAGDPAVYTFHYKATPGWKQFEATSTRVADEYAAGRTEWQAQLAERRTAIADRGVPLKPSV